jgi:hypothetical protein
MRCDLCGEPIAEAHAHLFELQERKLACVCDACSVLFDSIAGHRYRRVRPKAQRLDAIQVSDDTWKALGVPVGLAFFSRVSATGGIVAGYPGPAGAVEAVVDEPAWQSLTTEHPDLRDLAPDVEALLVNRLAADHRHYRVSIDWCYRLTGMVRSQWRGISGGAAVITAIQDFFHSLETAA